MIHALLLTSFSCLDEWQKNNNAQQDESDNDSCSAVETRVLLDKWEKKAEEITAKLERTKAELKEWSEREARNWEELQKNWEKYDKEEKEHQKRRAARQRQQKT
jgi:predicted RNase H-like nuclease (RuvC/YqgF family)